MVQSLRSPWRYGTVHLVNPPLAFMQQLAELLSIPRLCLIRFHVVLLLSDVSYAVGNSTT